MTLLALGWAVVCVLFLLSSDSGRRLREVDAPQRSRRSWGSATFWLVMLAVLVVLAVTTLSGASGGAWATVAVLLGGTAARQLSLWLERRRVAAARQRVSVAAQVVAAQLSSGATPRAALQVAAMECPTLELAVATASIGGDVSAALVRAGETIGQEGLASLGRAWRLGERLGAPMKGLADQVSQQVRSEQATRELVGAELAGPRASAKLMALLPLIGVGMGKVSGGDPVGFLLGSPPGQLCLVAGVALTCAGVVWSDRLGAGAEEA